MKKLLPFIFLAIACNAVKRVEKSPEKIQKVVDYYVKDYPIKTDTVLVHGDTMTNVIIGYDTTISVVPIHDTTERLHDTVIVKRITTTKTVHDTAYIQDNKAIAAAQKLLITKDALIDAYKLQISDDRKDIAKWKFRFWLLIILLALCLGLTLYLKLKPKIL